MCDKSTRVIDIWLYIINQDSQKTFHMPNKYAGTSIANLIMNV